MHFIRSVSLCVLGKCRLGNETKENDITRHNVMFVIMSRNIVLHFVYFIIEECVEKVHGTCKKISFFSTVSIQLKEFVSCRSFRLKFKFGEMVCSSDMRF